MNQNLEKYLQKKRESKLQKHQRKWVFMFFVVESSFVSMVKRMKFVLSLLAVLVISGCDSSHIHYPPSRKESLANQVTNEAFVQLKKEKKLHPFGMGGQMMDQIKKLTWAFLYYEELNIEDARRLLIESGDVILGIVNRNDEIIPYLQNYPFKPENVQIEIYLKKPDGSDFSHDKLCVITMRRGVLDYSATNPETDRLLTVLEESYEEAVAKLNKSTRGNNP